MLSRFWSWLRSLFDAFRTQPATLPADGIAWEFAAPPRVLVVGDLHGDLTALAALLVAGGFVDERGDWMAGDSHLVLLGDIWAGHPDSVFLVDTLIRLERQAKAARGAVHSLLGNHDLLPVQGTLRGLTGKEKRRFREVARERGYGASARDFFSGSHPYAKWVRGRNAILRIGDSLFVHAALGPWAAEEEMARINATVRAWLAHWQGVGPRPPKSTRWVVGKRKMARDSKWAEGPLWNRSYRVRDGKKGGTRKGKLRAAPLHAPLADEELARILSRLGVRRVIVGHAPVAEGKVLLSHPLYGEKVVMVDTRLSESSEKLGALILENEQPRAIVAEGRDGGRRLRDRWKQGATSARARPSVWRRCLMKWRRLFF